MASFAQSVFDVFRKLREDHRFVPVRVGASKRFASLLRRETDDVYSYLFVSDSRPSGGNIDVHLWLAPPDEPGDGLDSLYVGYKVRIGSEYEVDDNFFHKCQERIIHFLRCVPAIVPLISVELPRPAFQTQRWAAYQVERKAFAALLAIGAKGDPEAKTAIATSRRIAKDANKLDKIDEVCRPVAAKLIKEASRRGGIEELIDEDAETLASSLAIQLYVRDLGDLSTFNTSEVG